MNFAAKSARLDAPHVAALERHRSVIAGVHGLVPHFDPDDGGGAARVLLLLETPGPRGDRAVRFVSRDNPGGTARNIARFCDAAGLQRADTVLWNVVPWLVHAPNARNRAPKAGEIAAGLALLPDTLALLPRLRVAVLCGRVAAAAEPVVRRSRPDLAAVLRMPHPSPTFVCTAPGVAPGIVAVLTEAALLAG